MNILHAIQTAFQTHIQQLFNLEFATLETCELLLNVDEQKQAFGDLTTNSALLLAKELKKAPRDIANTIANGFSHPMIKKTEVAGPGFINMYLKKDAFKHLAEELFVQQDRYFKLSTAPSEVVDIEFVSANPTGPLHFGHGRGAIIGDVLTKILRFLGYNVTPEYYINDAGAQINKLGMSLKIRCEQILGYDVALPEDAYHGEYLLEVAKECLVAHGKEILNKDITFFSAYAQDRMLANIKHTLDQYGIQFDTWFSEKTLHTSGAIDMAIATLKNRGFIYEKDGAQWFKATTFGDDKDRVVRKANGELTYIAADIAYLKNKVERGHTNLIFVLGHDHHSYATRLETVRQGLGLDTIKLDTILYQLVKIKEGNVEVRMSKRAGNIISLQDVIDAVGTDVARFFYLHRKADAQLDFDLDLAQKKTDENPVYYVQYAYVRTNSILDKAAQESELNLITENDLEIIGMQEAFLLKKIVSLKQLLEAMSTNYQIHLLTYYVIELANAFHSYYRHNRVIDMEHVALSRGRLAVIKIVNNTFKLALDLLGISTPQRM